MLDSVPSLIEKTFPVPGRFRGSLPSNVAELSRLLTGSRGDRSLSYLSRPNFLSAYLRYFLPWNLYRLCNLLPSIDIPLRAGDTITDLGSGPLTFVIALWIARPDLRGIALDFYCVDRCSPALEAGKKLFSALCADEENPWKIHLVKMDIDIRSSHGGTGARGGRKGDSNLVCAVNLFNELYERIPHTNNEALRKMSQNIADFMNGYAAKDGCILTVEPGVPQSGKFIAFLRRAFLDIGRPPAAPCTHADECPLVKRDSRRGAKTQKERWCHFAYDTADAPKELQALSAAAGLPKERLVLSYLLAGSPPLPTPHSPLPTPTRVLSDSFPLPDGKFGRYGCCAKGLVLLKGEKNRLESMVSGSLVSDIMVSGGHDEKSGALIAGVK